MFYLYGIIDQPDAEYELPQGFGGSAVEIVTCGGEDAKLGAVVSEIGKEPDRNAKSAHTHMNVLTTLMQNCSVLPSRFGIVFPSRDELVETISRLHMPLRDDLHRLSGQVEVNIKVTDRSPLLVKPVCEPAEGPGETKPEGEEPAVRYVTSKGANIKIRAQQTRGNELLAETIQAPFAAMVTGKIWRAVPTASGRPQITANFLLPREQFDAFRDGVKDLQETSPRLEVRITGPWPPFSFISEESTVKTLSADPSAALTAEEAEAAVADTDAVAAAESAAIAAAVEGTMTNEAG
jgi:hypothetical protein